MCVHLMTYNNQYVYWLYQQLTKAYVAKTSCNQLLLILLCICSQSAHLIAVVTFPKVFRPWFKLWVNSIYSTVLCHVPMVTGCIQIYSAVRMYARNWETCSFWYAELVVVVCSWFCSCISVSKFSVKCRLPHIRAVASMYVSIQIVLLFVYALL